MANRFLTKVQKKFDKGRIFFPINSDGTIGHPYAKQTKTKQNNKKKTWPKLHILYKN